MSEIAPIITAVALLVTAVGTYLNGRSIRKVGKEITTSNSQTIAELMDATETRRIDKILPKNRTALENSHTKDLGEK